MERKIYYFIGGFFFLFGGFYAVVGLMVNSNPTILVLPILSMGVMGISLGYLSPQFRQNDERSRYIRQKGMVFSIGAIFIYQAIFILLLNFNFITISAIQLISILWTLTTCTVFLSMVIVSKYT
ncbi:permease [Evansella tamaricis]|uniref:Permease n=1 Tax=Evansella tamaricis TaxID=2069301 RepID=A0ABS6JLG9_9BACI|nr:permease [Evansella tamaricis]MBU9714240.1 permease [Evansella tamaricis]